MDEWRVAPCFFLIPIVFLAVAMADMPYGYYTFLRVVIALSAVYAAFEMYNNGNRFWPLFACIAILYNPIVPVHLTKDIWIWINFLTIAAFVYPTYWKWKARLADGKDKAPDE